MQEHPGKKKMLTRAIHTILLEEWDPIGVGNISEAQNEYDAYIPDIYEMIITKKPKHAILEYLCWLENTHIGVNGDREHTEKCAEQLYRLTEADQENPLE